MRTRIWLWSLAIITSVLGLGFVGWRVMRPTEVTECYACKRSLHAHSKTVAIVGGHTRTFCCPACALSEHEQDGKPIAITRLTAFLTGQGISPDQAFIVQGSDVNMCIKNEGLVDTDKQHAELHFDRCRPSMLAFSRRDEAAGFAAEHGGTVLTFKQLSSAFAK